MPYAQFSDGVKYVGDIHPEPKQIIDALSLAADAAGHEIEVLTYRSQNCGCAVGALAIDGGDDTIVAVMCQRCETCWLTCEDCGEISLDVSYCTPPNRYDDDGAVLCDGCYDRRINPADYHDWDNEVGGADQRGE